MSNFSPIARQSLVVFGCERSALEAMVTGRGLAVGTAVFEPLILRAELRLVEDGLRLAVDVTLPDIAPWGALAVTGEAGMLAPGGMWRATTVAAVLRPPVAALSPAKLGPRSEVLQYADAAGRVRFGVLMADLVLVPPPGSGVQRLRGARMSPDFVTRRLRAVNRQLEARIRSLEKDAGPEPPGVVAQCRCLAAQNPGVPMPEPPASCTRGFEKTAETPTAEAKVSNCARELGETAAMLATLATLAAQPRQPAELRAIHAAAVSLAAAAAAQLEVAEGCAVCLAAPVGEAFRPCGHACCCAACAAALPQRLCPICRAPLEEAAAPANAANAAASAANQELAEPRLSNKS